jgi:phage baseplate assembly protein gpV
MMVTTSDTTIKRAQLASIPVYQYGGGDFILSFPLKAGDLGWIKANDRDISIFLQSYANSAPNTIRKKSFSDALFYPDVMRGYIIAGEDANNAVLQNISGTVKVSLGADKIKVSAPTVEIVATDVIITSSTLKHNGKNIGATHTHSGVTVGSGTTGVPT